MTIPYTGLLKTAYVTLTAKALNLMMDARSIEGPDSNMVACAWIG